MSALRSVLALLAVAMLASSPAHGQAIIGTTDGSDQAIVYPSPGVGLPAPTAIPVPGIPTSARPHGVAYYGANNALVSGFSASKIFVVQISTATLVDTIDTAAAGYDGTGTIAVTPSLTYALAAAGSTLFRIAAPFAAGATITTVPLTGSLAGYQTQAIVFAPTGRAFVYTSSGINVLDFPYTSVTFVIPVSNGSSGAIAITPDGNQLLVTNLSSATVQIFTAPYSAGSTAVTLSLPGANGPDGIMVTPDGSKAIVASAFGPAAHAVSAPFSAASLVEQIPLPTAFSVGFEDVGISADGQLAILAGNGSGSQPGCFIQAPFTAAGAIVHTVAITGGRGNGAVRFLPPGLAAGLTVNKTGPASAASGSNITYTINYANTGGAPATGVIIKDTVPAGTTFVSATGGGTLGAGVVTWTIGTLAPGASGSVQFTVTINAPSGVISNDTYTIEGDNVPPIFGPPVTTDINAGPTPTPTPTASPTPPSTPAPIPATSKGGIATLALLLAFAAVVLLFRRSA